MVGESDFRPDEHQPVPGVVDLTDLQGFVVVGDYLRAQCEWADVNYAQGWVFEFENPRHLAVLLLQKLLSRESFHFCHRKAVDVYFNPLFKLNLLPVLLKHSLPILKPLNQFECIAPESVPGLLQVEIAPPHPLNEVYLLEHHNHLPELYLLLLHLEPRLDLHDGSHPAHLPAESELLRSAFLE